MLITRPKRMRQLPSITRRPATNAQAPMIAKQTSVQKAS
jgi:hypothetical protein